jgi:hypothetical protein
VNNGNGYCHRTRGASGGSDAPLAEWSDAYPLYAFPEPDDDYYRKARHVLEANGMILDRLSAAAMRHVMLGVGRIAKEALNE